MRNRKKIGRLTVDDYQSKLSPETEIFYCEVSVQGLLLENEGQ
jgi:hypothetical protein